MKKTRWMAAAAMVASAAGCTGSPPAASVNGSVPGRPGTPTTSPAGDAPVKLVATTTLYPPAKAPVRVDGRHAAVVSPSSFAIEVSDNGNCRPTVKTAALRPPALRISIDRGRCYVLNETVFVAVVNVGVPIFSPSSHGPQIRTVDVEGDGGKIMRLPIVRT